MNEQDTVGALLRPDPPDEAALKAVPTHLVVRAARAAELQGFVSRAQLLLHALEDRGAVAAGDARPPTDYSPDGGNDAAP